MALTPATFRAQFGTAFLNAAMFTNDMIQNELNDAYAQMDVNRWGPQLDTGAGLRAAHFLVLLARAAQGAAVGGIPGQPTGLVSSKGVGPASVSYDTNAGIDKTAASWNLTTYGQLYWRRARLVGMGGLLSLWP